jgi:hypothetical protein
MLMTFLERGCDPTKRKRPRRVFSVRALTAGELAELHPGAWSLVPLTNLRWLPRTGRSLSPHRS